MMIIWKTMNRIDDIQYEMLSCVVSLVCVVSQVINGLYLLSKFKQIRPLGVFGAVNISKFPY